MKKFIQVGGGYNWERKISYFKVFYIINKKEKYIKKLKKKKIKSKINIDYITNTQRLEQGGRPRPSNFIFDI